MLPSASAAMAPAMSESGMRRNVSINVARTRATSSAIIAVSPTVTPAGNDERIQGSSATPASASWVSAWARC